MLAIFSTGVCPWFLYGLTLHAWPIILTKAVTLMLTGAILTRKLRDRASGGWFGWLGQMCAIPWARACERLLQVR